MVFSKQKSHYMVTEGDIIFIPEGEVHWHGAQEDSSFAHISLQAAGCKTSQIEE